MAWFDIVGGLAGGLQQGLGQLQQAQQAKQVEARQQALLEIQQAQERRAGEAAKRQADQERLEMFKQLLTGEDPLNVSGQTMGILQQKYGDLVPTAIAKNTETGVFELKMTPAQRAALVKERAKLAEGARYEALLANAPEGSLSAADAVKAVIRGGQDRTLVSALVKPSELLSFYTAIFPEKAFEGSLAQRREKLRAETEMAKERLRADRADREGLTDYQTAQILQRQLEPFQTAVTKARAEAALYPTDAAAQQALKESEAQLAAKEQQVYAAMMQKPSFAVVAPTFQPPSTAGIIVTAPDGSKHSFATQAEADRFKQLAGIK